MRVLTLLALAASLTLAGCKEEQKPAATVVAEPATTAGEGAGATATAPEPAAKTEGATQAPASQPTTATEHGSDPPTQIAQPSAPTYKCDRDKMEIAALTKGKKLMAGIHQDASILQAELLKAQPLYNGKTVRIEGPVVDVCQARGCWVAIEGPSGQRVNLKVKDGEIDFRTLVKKGQYVVGEGVFESKGHHGSQVKITGARIASTSCTQ